MSLHSDLSDAEQVLAMAPIAAGDKPQTVWGRYPWFPEDGFELIHPVDFPAWVDLRPYGRVFERVDVQREWITLAYGELVYRVKPDLFRPVRGPVRRIGETVQIETKGQLTQAVIADIAWHHKRDEAFYLVTTNSKRLSRRYFESDFR